MPGLILAAMIIAMVQPGCAGWPWRAQQDEGVGKTVGGAAIFGGEMVSAYDTVDMANAQPRYQNFLIILDTSASMTELVDGQTKFAMAKTLLTRMNIVTPDIRMQSGIRIFGNPVYTALVHGWKPYEKADFETALKEIKFANGASPLEFAIDAAIRDLTEVEGKAAIIIVSDGKGQVTHPEVNTERLKNRYGANVCIYAIIVGHDPEGERILREITRIGGCGFAVNADQIQTPETLIDLAGRIFTETSTPVAFADFTAQDPCAHMPGGIPIGPDDCWRVPPVLFDFDKRFIRGDMAPILDKVAQFMARESGIRLKIEGHADRIGSEPYNEELSVSRAMAGKKYLVEKGIHPDRIRIEGFGFTKPLTLNDTPEGRAQNRRIEFMRWEQGP